MSEYKRLTKQKWSKDIDLTQELGYSHIYKRLYELEDKLENGTLVESTCKVEDIPPYNKNIKFHLDSKEIPFEELSKLPQMTTDRENHTTTEIVLHYIDKDAIFFYTKTEHYAVVDGADEEYYGET